MIPSRGVLIRGKKKADLREKILKRGYIKVITGLLENLFYGSGISVLIIVLDKFQAWASPTDLAHRRV
ncbi:N-6 DNA methylase [Rhodovulum sulfidophilum]|uniref:N-6 DNA methylase n=1 Tax=Rhodovulum sulfidophilum TaxID=35806 RepID=UPI0009083104